MNATIKPIRPHLNVAGVTETQAPPLEGGDLILAYLQQIGVDYVFGIPGGAIEPLYNALARSARNDGIRHVTARHETGAALMAEGYARNSGKLGVCCSTTGPGATNLITGVASAYENQIPMLVITPQTSLSNFGRKAFQESSDTGVNIVGMFQHCTHYNTLISHIDQLEHKIASAIMTAFNARGPAHVSIPVDILKSRVTMPQPSYNLSSLLARSPWKDDLAIEQFLTMVLAATKPVFVLGSGCDDAVGLILRVAMTLGASVVTTPDGKGLVNPFHPNYRGVISFAGHRSAEDTLRDPEVDLVVTIGNVLSEWSTNNWDGETLLNSQLVHIDSNENNLTRSPMARLHVRGSIDAIFETVIEDLSKHGRFVGQLSLGEQPPAQDEPLNRFKVTDFDKCLDTSAPVKPQWLMTKLTQVLPPNTRYLADTGSSFAWTTHYLHPFDRRIIERRNRERGDRGRRSKRGGLFQAGFEFAPMGWAIGNAVGAALGSPGDPIVCITGDGSVLMSGQEITVAKQLNLPVIFLVMNDASLGMVSHGQRLNGAEEIGCELPRVNFKAFAESMGIRGHIIEAPQDLLAINLDAICKLSEPVLLDVRIDPTEVPPIGTRINALQQS